MKRIIMLLISLPIFLNANPISDYLKAVTTKTIGPNAHQPIIPGGPQRFTPFVQELSKLAQQHPDDAHSLVQLWKTSTNPHDQSCFALLSNALSSRTK